MERVAIWKRESPGHRRRSIKVRAGRPRTGTDAYRLGSDRAGSLHRPISDIPISDLDIAVVRYNLPLWKSHGIWVQADRGRAELGRRYMNLERITTLAATDGHNIPAYLFTPDSARGGAALIPPYGSTKEHLLGLAATLGDVGIAALLIDLCGHGENRTAIGPVMRDEVESAVRYVRRFGRTAAV